jgi:signal transduction histidine kinase
MVRSRLTIGFGVLVTLTLGTGAVALIALRSVVWRNDQMALDYAETLARAERLRYGAELVVATSRGYILTGEPGDRTRSASAARAFSSELLALRGTAASNTAARLDQIKAAGLGYLQAAAEAERRRVRSGDPRRVLPYFDDILRPQRVLLQDRLAQFVRAEREASQVQLARAQSEALGALVAVAMTTAMGLVVGVGLAVSVSRNLLDEFRTKERAVAARDEVLAVVAHDLREPLGTILAGSSILGKRLPPGGTALLPLAASIGRAARAMLSLIENVLEKARIDAGTMELLREPCDLAGLMAETRLLFQERADQRGVRLTTDVPPGMAAVCVDRERVLRVMANLVGNAMKFTPDGGEITLRASCEGGAIVISVSDTGPGIPAEDVPRLFDRNWQGRKSGSRGVGLGLYIARKIVEAHGGTIRAVSELGAGTSVLFSIPSAPAHSGEGGAGSAVTI